MGYGNNERYMGLFASEPLANVANNAAVAVFAKEPSQGRSTEEVEAIVKRAEEAAMNAVMQMSGKQKENVATVQIEIHCLCCDLTHTKPFEYSKLRYIRGRKNGGAWAWRRTAGGGYAGFSCKNCGQDAEWAPTDNEHTRRLENEAKEKAAGRKW